MSDEAEMDGRGKVEDYLRVRTKAKRQALHEEYLDARTAAFEAWLNGADADAFRKSLSDAHGKSGKDRIITAIKDAVEKDSKPVAAIRKKEDELEAWYTTMDLQVSVTPVEGLVGLMATITKQTA